MLMRPFIEDGKCYYYLDSKQANSSRDSIQSCKFNLYAKLEYCIKHFRTSTVSIQWVKDNKIINGQ